MLLDKILETTFEVRDKHPHQGRERIEISLSGEDGETLYLYEGHLKELGKKAPRLEVGKRYKAFFRPFVNNRWIEVKLVKVEAL